MTLGQFLFWTLMAGCASMVVVGLLSNRLRVKTFGRWFYGGATASGLAFLLILWCMANGGVLVRSSSAQDVVVKHNDHHIALTHAVTVLLEEAFGCVAHGLNSDKFHKEMVLHNNVPSYVYKVLREGKWQEVTDEEYYYLMKGKRLEQERRVKEMLQILDYLKQLSGSIVPD